MKTMQFENKVDGEVRRLKSDADALERSKSPEDANKRLSGALDTVDARKVHRGSRTTAQGPRPTFQ